MSTKVYQPHIDFLKGIAIISVVMAHALLFGINYGRTPIFNAIVSVHMPLFVMLSGVLSAKPIDFSIEGTLSYWKGKAIQLLLPLLILPHFYILVMKVPHERLLYNQYHSGYWFTLALFLMFVVFYVFRWVEHLLGKRANMIVAMTLAALSFGGVVGMDLLLSKHLPLLYTTLSWEHITWLYPYFLFGYFIGRYDWIERLVSDKLVVAAAFFGYVGLLYLEYNGYKPWRGYPVGAAGLVFLYGSAKMLCKEFKENGGGISKVIKEIGRMSLPIYLTHYFFIFSVPGVTEYLSSIPDQNRVLTLEFLALLLCAACILVPTIIVVKLIRSNSVLALILYGERGRKR